MSSLAFLSYTSLSNLAEEVEYIWLKPFSLPTLFYIFARYAALIGEGLSFTANISLIPPGRSCDMIANATNSMTILSYIGTQGLVLARGNSLCSLCEGTRFGVPLALTFRFCLIVQLIIPVYGMVVFPGCLTSLSDKGTSILLVQVIFTIAADIILSGLSICKLWGLWKLKHGFGIQIQKNLVFTIFKQSMSFVVVSSFSHAMSLTVGKTISVFSPTDKTKILQLFSRTPFTIINSNLAGVVVTYSTLNLRRLNSAKIETSNIVLPTLRSSNALQRGYQSRLVEMVNPDVINDRRDCGGNL